ncbi:MAG TPA: phage portal protein, partial [Clostridium sp.]|nr:phage portal protein [Clostridium sp.]
MGIKNIWSKIKKGVKAGVMAVLENNSLTDNKVILRINDFNNSDKRRWMSTGQSYYEVENV